MPHQQLVADVGCEIDPVTLLPAYREVGISLPRQSGKTTEILSWEIDRALNWGRPQRSAYTAQSGKDGRDKWLDEIFPMLRQSPLNELIAQINEGMGNESIRWKTGSIIRLLSTSTGAGHSKTLDQAALDEIWADQDDRREQGLRPAMITRPDAQLLWCSTAGTQASVVLNRKVQAGRLAAAENSGHGIAYFEWSAPKDWDPDDEDSYFSFMPALCPDPPCRCGASEGWRHTITLETIRVERDAMKPEEFLRAYGNRPTGRADNVIPMEIWRDACDPAASPSGKISFALEVAHDRSSAAIAAAGAGKIELIEHAPGTSWVVGRANELSATHGAQVAIDARGPAGGFADQIRRCNPMDGGEVIEACAAMYDAIADGTVKFRTDPAFDAAIEGVVKKQVGDRWVWSRMASAEDVTPLMAATLALAASRAAAGKKPPLFISMTPLEEPETA